MWSNKKCGCITNGKMQFNIGNVVVFEKLFEEPEKWCIRLGFSGYMSTLTWKDEKSRDDIWDFFMKVKEDHCEANLENSERIKATSQAQVLLQAKMTEKFLGHDCNG